jgi:hypothetical protein
MSLCTPPCWNIGCAGCWNGSTDDALDSRGATLLGMMATRSNCEAFAILVGRR